MSRRFAPPQLLLSLLLTATASLSTSRSQAEDQSLVPPPAAELMRPAERAKAPQSLHPPVILKDKTGARVAVSGQPLSPTQTCGSCHDLDFIVEHGFHFKPRPATESTGSEPRPPGEEPNPLYSGNGEPNCVYCHIRGVDPERVRGAIAEGQAELSATVLLEPLGFGRRTAAGWVWNAERFDAEGRADANFFRVAPPNSAVCGSCHGMAQPGAPKLSDYLERRGSTVTTGQIFSPLRISDSRLNVAGREGLGRPWDVHAERLLECRDCHAPPNAPATSIPLLGNPTLASLRSEVRHSSYGEFLRRPSHDFMRGSDHSSATAQSSPLVRCENCHEARSSHHFLPRLEQHLSRLSCESCHVGRVRAPARAVDDNTMPSALGQPRLEYRGVEGELTDPAAYIGGYRPVLLTRAEPSGKLRLFPSNLLTRFYWTVQGERGREAAPDELLARAFFEGGAHRPELIAALDRNHDGRVEASELELDSAQKVDTARGLLLEAGGRSPVIVGEIRAYPLHHSVAPARFAVRDCNECHGARSWPSAPVELARFAPYGVTPRFARGDERDSGVLLARTGNGRILLSPDPTALGLHILGTSRSTWLDFSGGALALLVLAGAAVHGGLRIRAARHQSKGAKP